MKTRSEAAKAKASEPKADEELTRVSSDAADAAEKKRRGYEWTTVQRSREPKLRPDMKQIVETHWIDDLDESWLRIRASLRVGEKRNQHGHLTKALDDARDLSSEAHGLFVTAQLEGKRWELANEATFAAMWNEAVAALEHEREAKIRSKAITDTDVRSKVSTLYPDEWAAQEMQREKVKLTVDRMRQLAKDAGDKADDIKIMLTRLRG